MSTLQDFSATEPTTDNEDDDCDCDELNGTLPCFDCYLSGEKTLSGEPA